MSYPPSYDPQGLSQPEQPPYPDQTQPYPAQYGQPSYGQMPQYPVQSQPYPAQYGQAGYPQSAPYYQVPPVSPEISGLSITAFVFSLLLPVVGLILALVARSQDQQQYGRMSSLTTAAVIISSIFAGIILAYILLVFFFLFIALLAST